MVWGEVVWGGVGWGGVGWGGVRCGMVQDVAASLKLKWSTSILFIFTLTLCMECMD